MFQSPKIALLVLCMGLLLCITASAQIGGSGWTPETLDFNVQKPYNVPLADRYTDTDGVYHLWVYNTDEPFSEGNTTRPRTEQRFEPDYTSGEIQYQSTMMVPDTETSNVCIMQIHTGDAQSPEFGSTTFMLFWYSSDGGSVHDYSGKELMGKLEGTWFNVNVDHNLVTRTIKVWINGTLVWTQQDNGATDFYLKDGVYMQNGGSAEMQVYIKNIFIWTSSGIAPPPTPTPTPKPTPTATPKPTPTATPNFALTASPSSQTAAASAGVSYTATATALNGFNGSIALSASGLPSGAGASFTPASISRAGSSTLAITTSCTTPVGAYSLTVNGSSGSLTHSATPVTLVVTAAPGDFTISAPSSQSVTVGSQASYAVTVGDTGCFSGSVALTVGGLPAGATASFTPASLTGSGSSTLSIATTSAILPGAYKLTISGTSGGLTHSVTTTLVVETTCVTTGATWKNTAITSETGTFTASFDSTPSASPINSVMALSHGTQTAYTGFATLARFNPSGDIDARNGGAYSAASAIPYVAGKTYHFRLAINIPAHTYSIFVTPPGGAELTVGSNFAFRSEQSTVTSLDHFGVYAETGSNTACNFTTQ